MEYIDCVKINLYKQFLKDRKSIVIIAFYRPFNFLEILVNKRGHYFFKKIEINNINQLKRLKTNIALYENLKSDFHSYSTDKDNILIFESFLIDLLFE